MEKRRESCDFQSGAVDRRLGGGAAAAMSRTIDAAFAETESSARHLQSDSSAFSLEPLWAKFTANK